MNNLNAKLVLFQFFGILFLIYGFQRLFYSFNTEEILYLLKDINETDRQKRLKILNEFVWNRIYWAFIVAGFGIIFVAFINWKNKTHYLNTILVSLFLLIAFISGIFLENSISKYFSLFENFFGKNYSYAYFTCGIILTLIGSLLVWKSIKIKKLTAHN